MSRSVLPASVRAGDTVRVVREVTAPGPALAHDALPDPFTARSPNVRATPGGVSDLSYDAVAERRGDHALPPTRVHLLDPLGASEPAVHEDRGEAHVLVEATAGRIGRLRTPRSWGASQYAEGDRTTRGPKTNEFRELRPYAPGDPLKTVNWKATARASLGDDLVLLVNEYEPEGKKSVWIFLDTSEGTARGTTTRDLLDVLVEGALSAADHYLGRGHRVGLATWGSEPVVVYPDHGREQYRRIATRLTYVKPAPPPSAESRGGTLAEAVEASHGFLVREKPMLVVFSSLTSREEQRGLERAQVLASAGRRPAPAILVHTTLGRTSGPDAVVDRLAEARSSASASTFRARGARVLRWNPDEAPLAALLSAGVA